MTHILPVVAMLVAALVAGCLEGPDAPDGGGASDEGSGASGSGQSDGRPRNDDLPPDYNFAWITGNHTAQGQDGEGMVGICGYPSPPEVDEPNRTITDGQALHDELEGKDLSKLRALVLLTQWDHSGCGILHSEVAAVFDGEEPVVRIDLLGGVTLGLRLEDDGSVTIFEDETPEEIAYQVEPGDDHRGSYAGEGENGTYEGDYRLRAMGLWPDDGVVLADGQ